jgi:hypothetical protein
MRAGLLILCVSLAAACGPEGDPEPPVLGDPDVSADVSGAETSPEIEGPTECSAGEALGTDGSCITLGVSGCDAMYMDPETGLCDPSRVECPPGQLVVFGGEDQGCRAIGIVDCHPDLFDGATGHCDPAPEACPEGSMTIPTQGCISLDPLDGCGESTWGNLEELPGDVYLDAGYAGDDSDGSRERPWTLYGYAIGKVEAGGRIVLAAGDYDGGMLITKSISLVGRCSSMVTLSGVREGAAGPTVLEVHGDVEVTVSDVAISGLGIGLVVHSGAQLSISRASITDNHTTGILASGTGTSLTATGVEVSGTELNGAGLFGYGIEAAHGASVNLSGSSVSENHSVGITAAGEETTVTVSDSSVSGTKLNGDGIRGYGVLAHLGATLSVSRSLVSDNHSAGVAAFDAGTHLTATEVRVSGTKKNGEGLRGYGVNATLGAQMSVTRSRVSENHRAGMVAFEADTSLTITEVWVSGTKLDAEGLRGYGVAAHSDGNVSVSRSRLSDNHSAGFLLFSAVGSVSYSFIETTKPGGEVLGDAILVVDSVVSVQSVVSQDNARAGMLFDKSEGEISRSLITQNIIGLADQGLPGVSVSGDNVITGNEQDRLDDGDLAIPEEAMALPSFPGNDR